MRILYGVVGEGMGHATRSRVVIDHLLEQDHEVCIVASGPAFRFMDERYAADPRVQVHRIHGFTLSYTGGQLSLSRSVAGNVWQGIFGSWRNVRVWFRIRRRFQAQAVISDFESWTWLYARMHRLPLVSIDNQQMLARFDHPGSVTRNHCFDYRLARLAVRVKLTGAYHYLATSFFDASLARPHTTVVPPILRPGVLAARPLRQGHVLVYHRASDPERLLPVLNSLPCSFRVYGMGKEGSQHGNVSFRAFSEQGFINDLAGARAVVGAAGYSLMGEAVHLNVPMLALPIAGQFEQELNARYLEELGYGQCADRLDRDGLAGFLANLPRHRAALAGYTPRTNAFLFGCLDHLLARIERSAPAPLNLGNGLQPVRPRLRLVGAA